MMRLELHRLISRNKEQKGENSCHFTDGPIMVGVWLCKEAFLARPILLPKNLLNMRRFSCMTRLWEP